MTIPNNSPVQQPSVQNIPVAAPVKVGHMVLTKDQTLAVQHLNSFIIGTENGTTFLQKHGNLRFLVRLFTRAVALTGIGYVGMLTSAALVDKINKVRAESQNKAIKNNIKNYFDLLQNSVAKDLRPEKPISIKDAKAFEEQDCNDTQMNKSLQDLIKSVAAKVSNSSFEDALKKYEDSINYFVKKAEKQGFSEKKIKDAKAKLVQNYYEAMSKNLGEQFAETLPFAELPTKEEIDSAANQLYGFIKDQMNTTPAVVRNKILFETKQAAGGLEQVDKIQKELETAINDIRNNPNNEQVQKLVDELKKQKGTPLFALAEGQSAEGKEAELQAIAKDLEARKAQLKDKNEKSIAFLITSGLSNLTAEALDKAKAEPDSEETNRKLNNGIIIPQDAEGKKEFIKQFKEIVNDLEQRIGLQEEIKNHQKKFDSIQKEIVDLHNKISNPVEIKEDLVGQIQPIIDVLKLISASQPLSSAKEEVKPVVVQPKKLSQYTDLKKIERILKIFDDTETTDAMIQEKIACLGNKGKRVYDLVVEQAKANDVEVFSWDKDYAFSHSYPSYIDKDGRHVVEDRSALKAALDAYAIELA
ncbi:MAG TPA: hypothetical protein VLG49_06170 [Rhabdochlamydiaceae bacterium]|nr:hypothetical protein [Rhabdochlamydiaceae bacterium]